MQIVSTRTDLRRSLHDARGAGKRIGLVPTMGALHEGHLSLARLIRAESDFVVMTIFVNPLQFNNVSDLEKYPRDLDGDAAAARTAGVDLLFAPEVQEIYPCGLDSGACRIIAGSLSKVLEGPKRPGHFDGVTTVVGILFNLVQPDAAIFGEKDFQQLQVLKQMTRDLHYPIRIIGAPIMREPEGLAMSSRNRRLSADQRRRALAIPAALFAAQKQFAAGERNARSIQEAVLNRLQGDLNLKVEYVSVVDPATLLEVPEIKGETRLLVAAWVDEIRLIDNVRLGG